MNPLDILRSDHEKIKALFAEFRALADGDPKEREHVAHELFMELEVHARIEEKLFYLWMRTAVPEESRGMIQEAVDEHDEVKMLIEEFSALSVESREFSEKIEELAMKVKHHTEKEENKLFPLAEDHISKEEQYRLGEDITELKHQLLVTAE